MCHCLVRSGDSQGKTLFQMQDVCSTQQGGLDDGKQADYIHEFMSNYETIIPVTGSDNKNNSNKLLEE